MNHFGMIVLFGELLVAANRCHFDSGGGSGALGPGSASSFNWLQLDCLARTRLLFRLSPSFLLGAFGLPNESDLVLAFVLVHYVLRRFRGVAGE